MGQHRTRLIRIIILASFSIILGLIGLKSAQNKFTVAANKPLHDLLFDSNRTGNYEIFSVSNDGVVTQLTSDSTYDSWWPKSAPDGKTFIFYRTPKGIHDSDYTATSLWAANRDGSQVRELIPNKGYGWAAQGHAEWAPNGASLIMFGGLGSLYSTDPDGSNPRLVPVTGQPSGITDPSLSSDGTTITYAYQDNVWKVSSIGGTPMQLTNDGYKDYDPYFSPDGQTIAFLTRTGTNPFGDWAIRLVDSTGLNLRFFINDGNINSKPTWSPDGSLIYFHRYPSGAGSGFFGLWVQDVNGTNLTPIEVGDGSNEYPAILFAVASQQSSNSTPTAPGNTPSSGSQPLAPQPGSTGTTSTTVNKDVLPSTDASDTNTVSSPASTGATNASQKSNVRLLITFIGVSIVAALVAFRFRHRLLHK